MLIVIVAVIVAIASLAAGFFLRKFITEAKITAAQGDAQKMISDAAREIETMQRASQVEAREEAQKLKEQTEEEWKQRRGENRKGEQRMEDKERAVSDREKELQRRDQSVQDREANSKKLNEELNQNLEEQRRQLERISELTSGQAKEILIRQVEEEARHDMAKMIRSIEEGSNRESDRRARNLLPLRIQRTAPTHDQTQQQCPGLFRWANALAGVANTLGMWAERVILR